MPRTIGRALPLALLAALGAVACAAEPVAWKEPAYASGGIAFLPDSSPAAPPSADACPGSARVAAMGGELHAVWWAPRADSSAALLAARSADGGTTWSAPVPVDTLDRGRAGCRRPPPALAADARTGYVDVVYFLQA